MSAALLIDDHLVLRTLLGEAPERLVDSGARLFTTGLWYHRLCRALTDDAVTGVLSRMLGDVEPAVGAGVVAQVAELPDEIGLVSLRALGWPMGELLHDGPRPNLLSLEALAAARYLDAEIVLAAADDNGPLRAAALHHHIRVGLVP